MRTVCKRVFLAPCRTSEVPLRHRDAEGPLLQIAVVRLPLNVVGQSLECLHHAFHALLRRCPVADASCRKAEPFGLLVL